MHFPDDRLYHADHLWAQKQDDGSWLIGITDYAQEQLGDITYVDLPAVGRSLSSGEDMGAVESVKAASELYCPVAGKVTKINPDLDASPELANSDPYGAGWMIEVELNEDPKGLLSPADYKKLIG